jgi:hypothetical protein
LNTVAGGGDGILFQAGEIEAQATPVYNEETGEAIVQFGGRQEQILFTGNGNPVTTGVDAAGAPLILVFTADLDASAPGGDVDVILGLQTYDDTAQFFAGFANPCAAPATTPGVCGSNFLNIGPEPYSFTVEGPSARPIGVAQFDTNANGVIDDSEFFAAIDQWVSGQIDDQLFFDVLDAWVAQSPVGTAGVGSSSATVTLSQNGRGLTLAVSGQDVSGVGLAVYDLNGQTVFTQETAGTTLSWNYLSSEGRLVANGVYLYVVTVKGADGRVLQSEVKKLVVLR